MKFAVEALAQVPFVAAASQISPILEGYSEESKFLVIKDEGKFLIRTFENQNFAQKQLEFSTIRRLEDVGVRCSRAVEIGRTREFGYMILTYLDGTNGERALLEMNREGQFKAGEAAGRELWKMNQLAPSTLVTSWEERRLEKTRRYMKAYTAGEEKFAHAGRVMEFIERNIHLMKDRPNTFQHDDYHPRNLIYNEGQFAGAIDFNRYDWGDPFHEFLKVGQFSVETSIPFSVGQIRGYFSGEDPNEEFWRLYSLYMAMAAFSSIVWTKHVCPGEMPTTLAQIGRVIDDHRAFEDIVPKWYQAYQVGSPEHD